ncbi:unnamed protein product [Nesidiocoris tenuis]|uniref:Uncharacterized protein n=1 Tax=Nesidiocoris tenuis TaxID=355587 RepID=A0A6H5G2D8_9HEMI|nr:unnamed protein product [Nesidiocoris tenuis]
MPAKISLGIVRRETPLGAFLSRKCLSENRASGSGGDMDSLNLRTSPTIAVARCKKGTSTDGPEGGLRRCGSKNELSCVAPELRSELDTGTFGLFHVAAADRIRKWNYGAKRASCRGDRQQGDLAGLPFVESVVNFLRTACRRVESNDNNRPRAQTVAVPAADEVVGPTATEARSEMFDRRIM